MPQESHYILNDVLPIINIKGVGPVLLVNTAKAIQYAPGVSLDSFLGDLRKQVAASSGAPNASLVSKADSGRAAIAVGDLFTVPQYVVGAKQLVVSLEGCLCDAGEQYSEEGGSGSLSTTIKWLCAVPADYTISIYVMP